MTAALVLWDEAVREAAPLLLRYEDGRVHVLGAGVWSRHRPGDDSVLARCTGPTLDVGCGPGRLVADLAARGIPALGIDIAAGAVHSARRRGALALRRDVFARIPGEGRWAHAVLADGNIGIGGAPVALLRRMRELLSPAGDVLVELDVDAAACHSHRVRLESGERVSSWFGWAHLGRHELPAVAASAAMRVAETWEEAGRCFASLRPE